MEKRTRSIDPGWVKYLQIVKLSITAFRQVLDSQRNGRSPELCKNYIAVINSFTLAPPFGYKFIPLYTTRKSVSIP